MVPLFTDGVFSVESNIPVLAYLHLSTLQSRRKNSVKVSASNQPNSPVFRLQQKEQRRLQPSKELEDPYIVAVLIALAQEQRTTSASLAAPALSSSTPGAFQAPEQKHYKVSAWNAFLLRWPYN